MVCEYGGAFVPSALATQLGAAGLDCGVTCEQDETGAVISVQVVVADGTDRAKIDAAVSAYQSPSAADIATVLDADSATGAIVTGNLQAAGIKPEEIRPTFEALLAQAKSAIPYYEGYTLAPDPATAWKNFQALDQATKDRLLYNCCRSLAAEMRYLSGVLQPA